MSCIGRLYGSWFHFGIALIKVRPDSERSQRKTRASHYSSNIILRTLFFEHGDLALILRTALAAGGADYGQHRQRFEGGAGDEDALRVRALVGRVYQETFG